MNSNIRAGAWSTCITPPHDISLAGGFTKIEPEEILDDLFANALVIDDGKTEAAVISADVCFIPDSVVFDVIDGINDKCGIKKENIIVTATHTHKGPELMGNLYENEQNQDFYLDYFKKCLVTSVFMAKKKKQPVRIGAGKGENTRHVFNRRLRKPDGSIIVNWIDKSLLQDCIGDGIVDPEMTVVKIDDANEKTVAFIVNYSLHDNAITRQLVISADLSGYMTKILKKVYGDDIVVLFMPGPCGNINWIDYRDFSQVFDLELFKKIGTGLAGTVLQIIPGLEYSEISDINVLHKELLIHDRPYSDSDGKIDGTFGPIDEYREVFEMYRKSKESNRDKELPVNKIDIHAVRIGDQIAIATSPAELFVEYGLEIKEKSPFKYTIVSEITNGYAGYVCTRKAFEEGGYEVKKLERGSHLAIDAGEKIADASVELLQRLK